MARFTGQTYGEATQQTQAQRAVPTGTTPVSAQAQQMAAQGPASQARAVPGAQPLNRPTERPNEPLTAGAPFGPGPGPLDSKIMPKMIPDSDVLDRLVALHNMFPNDQLRLLIQRMMER
jgi:hypothetical protein